ncbi:MAG TPA: hypothetical protein VJ323_12240 [Bryobacteraceae bacterium]|jgi:hypothetical protein|nr:hypothetical protein [Bryobacteraceae bacterium]
MKRFLRGALTAAFLTSTAVWAHSAGPAQHGGVVAAANELEYELVARSDLLQLYIRDHGKPVDVSKASAKVTLLSGDAKKDVELRPTADKLEATGTFDASPGTKAVAVINLSGKLLTARFTLK